MADLNDLYRDCETMEKAFKALGNTLPRIIGKESVDIIRENFTKQGYDSGQGTWKWRNRTRATNRMYDYNRTKSFRTKRGKRSTYKNPYKGSVYSSKNPILRQTGNLMDSISYRTNGNVIEIGVFPKIKRGANATDYAKIHNEGGTFKMFGKHTKQMPVRQFMPRPGDAANPKIIKAITEKYEHEETKIMQKWNVL